MRCCGSIQKQDEHRVLVSADGPHKPTQTSGAPSQHGDLFLLAGTKEKGRKPKGRPFLTLKAPEDTEINCHHTKPTGRQPSSHPQPVP